MLDGWQGHDQNKNVTAYPLYDFGGKGSRLAFKVAEHLHLCKMERWYGKWRSNVADFDTVIISDGIRGADVIEYIKKHNPRARIIIYYVNTFNDGDRNSPENYRRFGVEFATFDRQAAEKYGIKFKHYFYEYETEAKAAQRKGGDIEWDAVFFGVDKGRIDELLRLRDEMKEIGLKPIFFVVPWKRRKYTARQREILLENHVPYSKIAETIVRSRAVVDINMKGQSGITQRPMESMFLERKLITDNQDIVNYDFYDPRNVFIIGRDDFAALPQFIKSPYIPAEEEIKDGYRPKKWLEGFFDI